MWDALTLDGGFTLGADDTLISTSVGWRDFARQHPIWRTLAEPPRGATIWQMAAAPMFTVLIGEMIGGVRDTGEEARFNSVFFRDQEKCHVETVIGNRGEGVLAFDFWVASAQRLGDVASSVAHEPNGAEVAVCSNCRRVELHDQRLVEASYRLEQVQKSRAQCTLEQALCPECTDHLIAEILRLDCAQLKRNRAKAG